nr:hypothetical protein [Tanacetum cinerariifolium]
MVKLTTFAVIYKDYGGKPTVDLLRSFLNLGPASDWLTLSNRGGLGVPKALTKPITHLERWKGLKTSWWRSPKNPLFYHRGREMDLRSFIMEEVEGTSSKDIVKRKRIDEPTTEETHRNARKVPSQASKTPGATSEPIDVDSDPDFHELKEAADCHFMVAHVTPPSWKKNLKEISLEKLCDIHDRTYMRQVFLDNTLNKRTRKLMSALSKARASCDAIREREVAKDKAYAELEKKCQVNGLHREYSRLVLKEKDWVNYKHTLSILRAKDKAVVVIKVIPDGAMKLVCSDEMGLLVAKLVKTAIFRGLCTAFEEVAGLKEPFVLEKMPAGVTADPYASVEQLLSKKPQFLQSKPALSHFRLSSLKSWSLEMKVKSSRYGDAWKALMERENVGVDLTKSNLCPSFLEDPPRRVDGFEKLYDGRGRWGVAKDKAYAELEKKCNKALPDLEKIPLVKDWVNYEQTLSILRAKVEGLEFERERLKVSKGQLLHEIDSLKQNRATVVIKVIPGGAIKLLRSDEMGLLVTKLVKTAIFHDRCTTFEEVASLKEPFVLEKMLGYRTSSKE